MVDSNFKQPVRPRDRHCEPTGRRKAPPDDRLREAIHAATPRKDGLLRRFAFRNDVKHMRPHSRGAIRPGRA